MLLINVVMLKFSERDLIQAKAATGRLLIRALSQKAGHQMAQKKRNSVDVGIDPQFKREISQLLAEGEFSEALIVSSRGNVVFATDSSARAMEQSKFLTREAMETGTWSLEFSGSTWGVIWLTRRDIWISAPLLSQGQRLGGITISTSLMPIYQALRESEKMILLYILLDTLILVMFGIYLISRIVVKPIHSLLEMTEDYKEGDITPLFEESSRSEIGKLSRSLSIMLKRLAKNKRELKAHISSLEKANKELKQAQNEIIRSEKLASVGRLAAGIAHEIGNPIGIILGYLGLIRKGDIVEEEREDFLNRIESEITRVNHIIRQLLDFSRSSSGKPEKTHAHDLILNTLNILKPQPMMEDIRINSELKASFDTVFADPSQLQQVFMNIMMNVADALAGKDLSEDQASGIDKVDVPSDKKEFSIKSKNTGNSIELRFTDNGPGIPEEELGRIFDPFYTTKEPGKGTGLGLSVCYRIVEELKGNIRVKSSVEKGTTTIVTLPIYVEKKGDNHAGEKCPDC
jgi:signal transduction histidine kinase